MTLTANTGASRTRASIKAKLIRLKYKARLTATLQEKEIDDVIRFIDGQAGRNTARKGGLGRK